MNILDKIEIVCGDIRDIVADILVLKYADAFHGADFAVADRLSIQADVPKGQSKFFMGAMQEIPGRKIGADWVMYRGVGELFGFRYNEIRQFASSTLLEVSNRHPKSASVIATTIHGPGYGLDEREAFKSQLRGYLDLPEQETGGILKLLIVEQDEQRANRLRQIFQDVHTSKLLKDRRDQIALRGHQINFDPFLKLDEASGSKSHPPKEKAKLFAAMPFAEKYMDEYDIAFVEAAHTHGFICERLDRENYVGDVIDEIFKRIQNAAGVVALLNDNNPNVFLEVGYAMALDKPVILVAQDDQDIAFDLRGQRRQTYSRIAELRKEMTKLIGELKADGVLN